MQNTPLYRNMTESVIFQIENELSRYIDLKNMIRKRLETGFFSNHRRNQLYTLLGLVNAEIQRRMTSVELPKESELKLQIVQAKFDLQNKHNELSLNEVLRLKNRIKILEARGK